MSKSLQTLKTNIAKGSQRLSKTTIKNIVNAGEFEKIELAYSYDGREVHKGNIIENPVEWFNKEYDSVDVRLYKVEKGLVLIHLQFHSNLWYALHIDLNKNYETTNAPGAKAENKIQDVQIIETKNYLDTMQSKFKTGEGTAEELRSYYTYLIENVDSVKVVILDMLNNSDKHKRKRANTKAELTDDCYNNMVEALVYHVKDTLSYEMDFTDIKGARQRAIKKILDSATDEMMQTQYAKNKAEKEERTVQRKELIEGITNPQTLEDFQNVKYYRKDKTLTIEEQQRFDHIYSISQKEKREKEQQERKEKALATVTGSNDMYAITADVDTRDNSPLWVVKLINSISKEEWRIHDSQMKLINGYYSRFKKGHIFKYDPTSKLLGEQSEQTEAEQTETQTYSSNKSDKLRKVADNMQSTIDSKRADRKTNTAKRAREAAGQEQQADTMEQMQGVLRNIANAIESNELTFIGRIDSRAQVETLEKILQHANWRYKSVENIEYNVWHNSPITANVIRYAEIPSSTIYLRQLQSIINDIRNTDGFKLIANRLQKLIDNAKLKQKDPHHDPLIDISDYDAELDKIYKNTDVLKNQYFETAIEERRRLSRMGIESVEELREYLREYFNYRTVKSSIDPTQQKIKELERSLKFTQGHDTFFTPSNIALQMIELADISHNSMVLEPSAGIGNIADQIKKFVDNVDVCEQMYSYQELLTLKGFNVVGSDFLKYENNNYYDCIIMNPPFNQEQEHIKHAYDLLKVGGKLIAITSPHWTFANDKSSKEFRQWFENLNGEIVEELDSGTFEMTQVRSNIIVINKDTETMQKAV